MSRGARLGGTAVATVAVLVVTLAANVNAGTTPGHVHDHGGVDTFSLAVIVADTLLIVAVVAMLLRRPRGRD